MANYSCEEGYDLIGPTARICQPNGNWSDNAPVCESKQLIIGRTATSVTFDLVMLWYIFPVVDCMNLTDPSNGRVSLTTTIYGSVAAYTCEEGYMLMGSAMRQCMANGNWSQQEPVCRSKFCRVG